MQSLQYKLMFALEDTHWWFLGKREFIKTLLPKSPSNWNILDLGCGTGGTTRFLKYWGKVTGVESSPSAAKFLKKRRLNYQQISIERFRVLPNSFDLVTLLDVLYHRRIKSDEAVLKKAYDTLKPNGLLLITDSALPFLWSHHDEIMQARERYYLKKIVRKVQVAGFMIEKKSYIFFIVFPLFLTVRLLNKFIPFHTVTRVHPVMNRFLLTLCKIEAKLLPYFSFPIGSSIIILARKPKS